MVSAIITPKKICKQLNIEKSKRVNNLTEDEILKIREFIDSKHTVEGDLEEIFL